MARLGPGLDEAQEFGKAFGLEVGRTRDVATQLLVSLAPVRGYGHARVQREAPSPSDQGYRTSAPAVAGAELRWSRCEEALESLTVVGAEDLTPLHRGVPESDEELADLGRMLVATILGPPAEELLKA